MTREEALNKIGELVVYARAQGWDEEFTEAFETLSAEPCGYAISACVLDKIEEEINSPNRGTCDYFIVDRIEEIINKYKAGSEDKESE